MDQRELRGLRTYALYCIVAAALLAVVFLFYFSRTKQNIQEQAEAQLTEVTRQYANAIKADMRGNIQTVEALEMCIRDRACLLNYSWPGNVRELKNIIERAVILNAPLLELVSPSRATASGSGAGAFIIPDFPTIPELEERYLRYVLERTGGKVCGPDGAESLLHLKRSTIYLKLKKYGIIPSDFI